MIAPDLDGEELLRFAVPGRPVAWARPRPRGKADRSRGRGGAMFTEASNDAAINRVAWSARAAHRGPSITGAVVVRVACVFPRPKRLKTGPREWCEGPTNVGDSDNLAKLVLEALERSGVLGNDRQVVAPVPVRLYAASGEGPCTEVIVCRPGPAPSGFAGLAA